MATSARNALTSLVAEFTFDELALVLGLTLVTVGGWAIVGRASLIVPGVVLVWMALPTRATFIQRQEPRK